MVGHVEPIHKCHFSKIHTSLSCPADFPLINHTFIRLAHPFTSEVRLTWGFVLQVPRNNLVQLLPRDPSLWSYLLPIHLFLKRHPSHVNLHPWPVRRSSYMHDEANICLSYSQRGKNKYPLFHEPYSASIPSCGSGPYILYSYMYVLRCGQFCIASLPSRGLIPFPEVLTSNFD